MRLLVQRVFEASVTVEDKLVGSIGQGILCYLGIHRDDTLEDLEDLLSQLVKLPIWPNDQNKHWKCNLIDLKYSCLVVSQFTLYAIPFKKGKVIDFHQAMKPDEARRLYELFVEKLRLLGVPTEMGSFQSLMKVSSINDGPVNIVLDSKKKKVDDLIKSTEKLRLESQS